MNVSVAERVLEKNSTEEALHPLMSVSVERGTTSFNVYQTVERHYIP